MKLFSKLRTMFTTPIWWWHIIALQPLFKPIPPGLYFVNFVFQRILGINFDCNKMVHFSSRIVCAKKLVLEEGVNPSRSLAVSGGCYIQAFNGIKIGTGTIFAAGVKIISANHDLNAGTPAWTESEVVTIGKNCWLGANSVILPGVTLGDHCIVGAGAVVTRSFPSNSVVAGVPAKVIRSENKSERDARQ